MGTYFSLSGKGRAVRRGGCLFEAGCLLTFSASRMDAYSRWALIRGWALIRINTVITNSVKRIINKQNVSAKSRMCGEGD